MSFSRTVDTKRLEITFKDINTKKILSVSEVKASPDDMRTVLITFSTKFELSHTYELTLKKVFSLDGTELPTESRIPLKILYGGSLPPVVTGEASSSTTVSTPPAPLIEPDPVEKFEKPVAIDKLPQTGPRDFAALVVITLLIAFFLQKKLIVRR